jgi:hypothetical protein
MDLRGVDELKAIAERLRMFQQNAAGVSQHAQMR